MAGTPKAGERVTITAADHPHTGESGIVTGEVVAATGQIIIEMNSDCIHFAPGIDSHVGVMADELEQGTDTAPPGPGRPTTFTQDLADAICSELSEGKSMRTVCGAEDMPNKSTVFKWLRERKDFSDQYTRAKQEAADAMAEDLLDIADDGTNDYMTVKFGDEEREVLNHEALQRSKLRVDTRKFLMAKMKPKVYGDKMDLTTDGKELPAPIFGGRSVNTSRGATGNNS